MQRLRSIIPTLKLSKKVIKRIAKPRSTKICTALSSEPIRATLNVEKRHACWHRGSVVNDAGSSSGALVCCCIYGPINETNVAQLEIDGLTLDGLKVDGVNGNTSYAPLLINEMQTCVNLSAKNISSTMLCERGQRAATSLFGRLGVGKNSDQVTAKFERISLPSQNSNTIFTHASLLESFGYKSTGTGSADYTFTKPMPMPEW